MPRNPVTQQPAPDKTAAGNRQNEPVLADSEIERVLVVAAHPDDADFDNTSREPTGSLDEAFRVVSTPG